MSENIGQVYYARKKKTQFLEMMPEGAAEYSEATADAIDREVKSIISSQYERTLKIIQDRKDSLEKGSRILLEKEKIDAAEIKTLMGL